MSQVVKIAPRGDEPTIFRGLLAKDLGPSKDLPGMHEVEVALGSQTYTTYWHPDELLPIEEVVQK